MLLSPSRGPNARFVAVVAALLFAGLITTAASARFAQAADSPGIHLPAERSPFHYPKSASAIAVHILGRGRYLHSRWTHLTYSEAAGDAVPAILIAPLHASRVRPAPLLLLVHGLGGRKEDMLPIARLAAQDGYASLSFDLPDSGERKGDPPKIGNIDSLVSYVSSELAESVDDAGAGLTYALSQPWVNTGRVGVVGLSLGSFVATDLAAVDPRIKVVILLSSGGGLGDILEFQGGSNASMGSRYGSMLATTSAAALDRKLRAVDPLTYVAHIAPRPLLMVNGGADPIIPPSAAQHLYAAARQPKQMDIFSGEGHVPSPLGIFASVSVFLRRWLPA